MTPTMTPEEVCIDARNVNVEIGGETILTDVTMSVSRNEIVTIVGPNGAGKTVLIRTLLGLISPTKGIVRRSRNLRIGYVPQKLTFDPILPISARRFLSLSARGKANEIDRVLAALKIEALQDDLIFTLSGGELQRLIIARALLGDPDILVLDEPTQGVDIGGQIELYRLIGEIRKKTKSGILMVSHDLHLVMAATDHVICLNRHICCSGHPESVSQNPAYLALFGDGAAKEIAVYTHQHDHRHAPGGEIIDVSGDSKTGANG